MTASRFGITGLYTIASVLDVKESMNYDHTIFPNPNLFFFVFCFCVKRYFIADTKSTAQRLQRASYQLQTHQTIQ